MTTVAILVVVAMAAFGLFALFVKWERTGREHWVVYLMLGLLCDPDRLVRGPGQHDPGFFHPGTEAFDFANPKSSSLSPCWPGLVVWSPTAGGASGLGLIAFTSWMMVELAEGSASQQLRAHSVRGEAGHLRGRGLCACFGGPRSPVPRGRALTRLLRFAALAAAVLLVLTETHQVYAVNVPLFDLPDFGILSGDAGAVFVAVGLVGLLVELAKERRDLGDLLACTVLLICPLFIGQRAVLLMEGGALAVVLVAAFGKSARRRLHLRVMPVVLAALSIVGVVVVLEVIPAVNGHGTVSVPLSSSIVSTLEAPQKVESAQDRLDKWQVIYGDVHQHPFIGEGLGFEYSYYDPGPNQFVVTDEADNMWLDLLLWTGLIGLVLFVLAIVPALVNGITTWRHHVDPTVAALALALVAVVVGLLTKGAVESIFEKYREATLLGLSLGMLRSAVTSRQQSWVPASALDVEARV